MEKIVFVGDEDNQRRERIATAALAALIAAPWTDQDARNMANGVQPRGAALLSAAAVTYADTLIEALDRRPGGAPKPAADAASKFFLCGRGESLPYDTQRWDEEGKRWVSAPEDEAAYIERLGATLLKQPVSIEKSDSDDDRPTDPTEGGEWQPIATAPGTPSGYTCLVRYADGTEEEAKIYSQRNEDGSQRVVAGGIWLNYNADSGDLPAWWKPL